MDGISTVIRDPAVMDRQLAAVNQDARNLIQHGPVIVTVGIFHSKRTIDQNSMFRGLCRDIADAWNKHNNTTTSPEAVARDLKVEYGVIVTEYSPVTGKRSARIKSTAEYSKSEMSALLDATLAWAADHCIPLRDPREDHNR